MQGEFYVVENKAQPATEAGSATEATNLAYTGLPLQFHTDLPHYNSPPQVQLLHCIAQCGCEGGSNKLVDGFAVAEHMRQHHSEAFELLATVEMEYKDFHREVLWDSGPGGEHSQTAHRLDAPQYGNRREIDFFLRQAHPIISLEDKHDLARAPIARINYSDHHRDSVFNSISPQKVKAY